MSELAIFQLEYSVQYPVSWKEDNIDQKHSNYQRPGNRPCICHYKHLQNEGDTVTPILSSLFLQI